MMDWDSLKAELDQRNMRGKHIRTIEDAGRTDWVRPRHCQWGVEGTILRHSNSHGLCFLVLHTDGTEEWYDADELEVVDPTPKPSEENVPNSDESGVSKEGGREFDDPIKEACYLEGWKEGWQEAEKRFKESGEPGFSAVGESTLKRKWVIQVGGGYGEFFIDGTEEEAEEMRKHKATWEGAIARKRLADKDEIKSGIIDQCKAHPNFATRIHCDCPKCSNPALPDSTKADEVSLNLKKEKDMDTDKEE